jgi:hypothetical protein
MTSFRSKPSSPDPTSLLHRMDELRAQLIRQNPLKLADLTGSSYVADKLNHTKGEAGIFQLNVWGNPIQLSFPDFLAVQASSGLPVSPIIQLLLIYYFHTADGAAITGQLISFRELPDGLFYNQAFQGYSGGELFRFFGNRKDTFQKAAENAGGRINVYAPGDLSLCYQALPRISLHISYWEGDEDFPSSYQVLFDASVSHYLPTDACAILGSTLVGMIKKARI